MHVVVLAEFWFISQLGIIPLAAITLAFPAIMLTQQMAFGALGGAVTSSICKKLRSARDKLELKDYYGTHYIFHCFRSLSSF